MINKKHLVRFLRERRRGVYTMLVKAYVDLVSTMPIKMAQELIKEDLEKESGENIDLHYFSLAKAITRFKKKGGAQTIIKPKHEFKDVHEIKKGQSSTVLFQINEDKVKDVK